MSTQEDREIEESDPAQTQPRKGEILLSRRQFFAGALIGGVVGGAGLLSTTGVYEELEKNLVDKPVIDRLRDEALLNRRAGLRTAVETLVVWAGNMGLCEVLDRNGIVHGTHAADGELYLEEAGKHPIRTYVKENVAIPVVEEVLMRLLPSALFREGRGPDLNLRWDVGLTSNLLFGLIHNFSKPSPDKLAFHVNSLPLEQLILGTYCWYAQRTGGFVHAASAHVAYNNLCMLYPNLFGTKRDEQA